MSKSDRRSKGQGQGQKTLAGYEVLLCVGGGIACYKSADLASDLRQAGAGVTVAMTAAATRFIQPLVFQTLTERQVYTSLWTRAEDFRSQHVSLTESADLMVIAPATANTLGKLAAGIADDLVTTLAMATATRCPVLLAPAMNVRMWSAKPVQVNVQRLKEWGFHFVGPVEGRLADGTIGTGRMSEPAEILQAAKDILLQKPPCRKR